MPNELENELDDLFKEILMIPAVVDKSKYFEFIKQRIQAIKDKINDSKESIIKWKKYPADKPKEYTPQCIILTKNGLFIGNAFWSPVDSKHNDSVWNEADYYLSYEDLRKLEKS